NKLVGVFYVCSNQTPESVLRQTRRQKCAADFKEAGPGEPDHLAMMTTAADDETIEATALSTSLDPYGQLLRVLMPRASYITIFDRLGTPLWLSDGYDGFDLLHLVEESLNAARTAGAADHDENRHGFSRSWDGDTAYVFILRDGSNLLGAV